MTSFASVTVSRIAVPDCCGWRFSCPDCRRDWFLFDWPDSRLPHYLHCPHCGRALVVDAPRP